jgi:L-arabinose isomerase
MTSNATCWFLTGSQGLYGPETLAQVEQQSRTIVDQLNDAGTLPIQVAWQPVLTDSSAIHMIILAANADPDCVGLIAWMHTFSPAKMWITGLDALKTPLLHLHTQANMSLPWAEIDMDFMNLNQAAHGDREFGYIQTRIGVPRTTVAGHMSDPAGQARIAGWQRAAKGVAAIRTLKLARFGDNMRDVAVTEGDKVEAELRFGVSVNTYGVNDLVQRVDAVSDTEIDDLIGRYADSYDIAPELRPGGDRHESLRYGAAIEAGLRSFLTEGGFGALTTNFQDLGGLRQLPGLAVQRLMADGRLVGDRRRGRRPGRGIRHRPGQPRQVSTPTGPTRRPTEPTHQPTQTIRARRVP